MKKIFPIFWLIALAAAMMLFNTYKASFVLVAVSIIAIGFAFIILKADLPRRFAPIHAVFLLPIFAFWSLAGLSVLFSEAPYISMIYLGFFSALPITICCSILVRDKATFFRIIGGGVALILAGLSIESLEQFITKGPLLLFGRTYWPFSDPNTLAGFLSFGVFGGAMLMVAKTNRTFKIIGVGFAALCFAALLTTGSRGALIALAVSFPIFVWLSFEQFKPYKKFCIVLSVVVALSAAALQLFSSPATGSAAGRVANTLTGAEPLLWDRPAIWASAWQIMKTHFWNGTGIGTFYLYYPEVRGSDVYSAGKMVHSDPLQYGVELGIFGPVLFYVILIAVFVMTWSAFRKLPKENDERVYIAASFCALGAFVAQAHVNFHFNILPLLMVAGFTLAFWFWRVRGVLGDQFGPVKAVALPGPELQKVILILPLLFATYWFAMLQSANVIMERGDARGQRGDIAGFVRDINLADRIAQHKNAPALAMAARLKLTELQKLGGIVRPNSQAVHDEAEDLLNRAENLNARSVSVPHTRAGLAHVAALLGLTSTRSQEDELLKAVKMNPLYYPARIDLADYYKRKGPKEKVLPTLKEGLKWQNATDVMPEFYAQLGRAAEREGDKETLELAKKKLAQYGIDYKTLR